MPADPLPTTPEPERELDRLKRALRTWSNFEQADEAAAPEELLAQHADIEDLLRPLLAGAGREVHVLGDYELGAELGRGGMGVVYEAVQRSLGRRVALKLLSPGLLPNPRARARFAREARLAARLDHPGIARVLGVEVHGEAACYAMELVDGLSMDRVLRRLDATGDVDAATGGAVRAAVDDADTTPASVAVWHDDYLQVVLRIALQVAEALEHAHGLGIVHRDIKPGNVMLRRNGTVVLTDFGLARQLDDPGLTQTGDFVGTPHYVSPEQACGDARRVDPRSDVFSLGVVLYELLTWRRPFDASTPAEVRLRVQTKEPPRPRRFTRRVGGDLTAVLQRALEKDPARRYASSAAFAEDLRALVAGRAVSARPVSRSTVAWRWCRRNPLATASLLVLATGCTVIGLLAIDVAAAAARERAAAVTENLETGRLLTRSTNHAAEARLWRAHAVRHDEETHWALVEFYRRFRCRRTFGSPADPVLQLATDEAGASLLMLFASGEVAVYDARDMDAAPRALHLEAPLQVRALAMGAAHVVVDRGGPDLELVDCRTGTRGAAALGERPTVGPAWFVTDGRLVTHAALISAGRSQWRCVDLASGAVTDALELPTECVCIAARGEEWLAWTGDGRLEIRDAQGRSQTTRWHGGATIVAPTEIQPVPGARAFYARAGTMRSFWRDDHGWRSRELQAPGGFSNVLPDGTAVGWSQTVLRAMSTTSDQPLRQQPFENGRAGVLTTAGYATIYADGSVRLWDPSATEPRTWSAGAATQHCVSFLDDDVVLSGGAANTEDQPPALLTRCVVGDRAAHAPQVVVAAPGLASCLAVAPGRDLVASGRHVYAGSGPETLGLWRIGPDGQLVHDVSLDRSRPGINDVVFRGDGQQLAAVRNGTPTVSVWTRPFTPEDRIDLTAPRARLAAVAYLGDGSLVAAGRRGRLVMWSGARPDEPAREFYRDPDGHAFRALVSFFDSGVDHMVVGVADGTIASWTLPGPREPRRLSGHRHQVFALAAARRGDQLLLASGDTAGRLLLWDLRRGTLLCELSGTSDEDASWFDLAFSPDGSLLAAAGSPHFVSVFRTGYAHDFVAGNASRLRFVEEGR